MLAVMFEDLYDALSFAWSWHWPAAEGKVTDVGIQWGRDRATQLSVAYEFFVQGDGPYTGESCWYPQLCSIKRVKKARTVMRKNHPVQVRYRPDDPSVNRLDRSVWRGL